MLKTVSYLVFFALCFSANAWTGKVDEVYDIEETNMYSEGCYWADDYVYTMSLSRQELFRIDPDDLDKDKANKVAKISDIPSGIGGQAGLSVCASKDKERIYGCIYSPDNTEQGGVIMWNEDMEWQKTYLYPGITSFADCIVSDDQKLVWFTFSREGQIMVCDLDLDSCSVYASGGDMVSVSSSPLEGYSLGCNGIEYYDDDDEPFLLTGNYDDGKLVKVMVDESSALRTISRVTVTDPDNQMPSSVTNWLLGVDGIVRVDDDVLIVATKARMILMQSSDKFATAQIKKVVETLYIDSDGSTSAALKYGDRASKSDIQLYVVFPSFRSTFTGVLNQSTFKFALIRFSDEDVDDLDWARVLVASLLVWFF